MQKSRGGKDNGQQQNTKLRDQLDNTTRLLDLRPEFREPRISFSKYMEEM